MDVLNCSKSVFSARILSKFQSGRKLTLPLAIIRFVSSLNLSGTNSSDGPILAISFISSLPLTSITLKTPEERISQDRATRSPFLDGFKAIKMLSFLSFRRLSSVSVPGVIIRVNFLSRGPFLGSPICSQMPTLTPWLTSLTRYWSRVTKGTPAIGIRSPDGVLEREVSVRPKRR